MDESQGFIAPFLTKRVRTTILLLHLANPVPIRSLKGMDY